MAGNVIEGWAANCTQKYGIRAQARFQCVRRQRIIRRGQSSPANVFFSQPNRVAIQVADVAKNGNRLSRDFRPDSIAWQYRDIQEHALILSRSGF